MLHAPLSQVLKTTKFHLHRLEELGIHTVEDFLKYYPRRYTDQREIKPIAELIAGEIQTVQATIKSVNHRPGFGGRMTLTTALLADSTGSISAVWFNQPFRKNTLIPNTEVMVMGKVKQDTKRATLSFVSPEVELLRSEQVHTARIIPVYHETELGSEKKVAGKISSKWIREKLFPLIGYAKDLPELLPLELRKKHQLISIADAVKNVHFPESESILEKAKRRLSFEELFLLQLAALFRRSQWRAVAEDQKKQIDADWELIKSFIEHLPWPLTNAQKKSLYEILKDIEKPYPMSRLLQGDTGSGKTVVAAGAMLRAIKAGFQTALLAPTEILARQHHKTLTQVLEPFNIIPVLITGSIKSAEKKEILQQLKEGKIHLIVGTHALLQEKVTFDNLGLAVVDEQHRFGVKQRELLKSYGSPHLLAMSATPIPRTLALVIYGDQDLSILDEMPPGRQTIITRLVPENKRPEAYEWIEKQIDEGRQVFFVFPLINESEKLQVKAATVEWEQLSSHIFPNRKVGLLHGKLSSEEKQETMNKFKEGKLDILVSTSVIEVGVDVPNATIIVIEGAERFGLAQLHQFRGRVGRGEHQSYCFLFPTTLTPQIRKRLHALVEHHSGFELAEIDLQLRGPGEVYGVAQSGIPDLIMASLSDSVTIAEARGAAEEILESDPKLNQHPELKEKIGEQENIAIDY